MRTYKHNLYIFQFTKKENNTERKITDTGVWRIVGQCSKWVMDWYFLGKTLYTEPIMVIYLPQPWDSSCVNCKVYFIERKIHVYVGRKEHVHNVQQNGGWRSYTLECVRNNVTSKKMQNNIIYHADACMKGRRSCSQERTLPCLSFVCVEQLDSHTYTLYHQNRRHYFPLAGPPS